MARLATSAVQLCRQLQDLYPQKLHMQNNKSEQSSPFRRWTTGSGAGSSYRHHDHRNMYNKQMSESAASVPSGGGGGGGCGGVARWSLGLEQLLADPAGASAFAHFLAKEFAAENIKFWWSCEQYRCCEEEKRQELADEIWQKHLAEKAAEPVNVDAAARRAAALRLSQQPPPQDLFNQAQKQIFNVMKFDSYPRFLRSGVHAECARADLRGLPPPYAPPQAEGSPTKLKKSSSNASERRRSGGASLLPWRSRAASRERPPEPQPQHTDVVKTSQTSNGECSLCRVVLPDGATSVVGVEPELTVARLVERLLQRRNLVCGNYDVVLPDNQGESRTVPGSASSTALGGRVARVERRVVLRLQLDGRALLVRCRPARRLRHVLRPVLQRYCRAPVLCRLEHGAVLHPDTPVTELDGARLLLQPDAGAAPEPLPEPDDDLSDVALRLQDDDESSTRSVSSSSGFTSVAGEGARVRAALRPGPALHNHPPDFLENLRETQRQRLQVRTPPPLPPKPAPRAPTLV